MYYIVYVCILSFLCIHPWAILGGSLGDPWGRLHVCLMFGRKLLLSNSGAKVQLFFELCKKKE